ncbi:Conserved_hypothetical protein [Hexamita inflata]|uniref:Uncharacterized protein n=1 Tax=Hexamita inflata TaxID=28002 RepID=A0ABP1HI82_9EUKA
MLCCGTRKTTKPFTTENFLSQQPFDSNSALYGTDKGKIFLFNFATLKCSLIADLHSPVQTIVNYQKECFAGTSSGGVYIITNISIKPSQPVLLGSMQSSVIRLYIFGDGANKYLYAASENNRLNGYILSRVRSSFGQIAGRSNSNSNSQLNNSKLIDQNEFEAERQRNSSIQFAILQEESESDNLSSVDQIAPAFSIKFENGQPTFLHGSQNVLAFCSLDGDVRFYSQLSNQQISQYRLNRSYPVSCCMHLRKVQGQEQLFCEIGYQSGEAISFNVNRQSAKEIEFWRRKKENKEIQQVVQQEIKPDNDNEISDSQTIRLKSGNINSILNIISTMDQPMQTQETISIQTIDQHKLEKIAFVNGLRAIWMFDNRIAAADNNTAYLFVKQQVSGSEESYLVVDEVRFDEEQPTRLEFQQYNDVVMLYGIFSAGKLMRAKIINEKWVFQWVK